MTRLPIAPGLLLLALVAFQPLPQPRAHSAGEEMVEAAQHFLDALAPEQRAKATFEFDNAERKNWHFIPKPRHGLPLKEMTSAQHKLAHALLSSALSNSGYIKASSIMSLEQVLHDVEAGSGSTMVRDPELYYFSIFGKPGDGHWGWRVEGHHLSVNITADGENILGVTPSFLGSNPAEVKDGPRRGLRVLADEEDLGRALLQSLSPEQQRLAILDTPAPREIITGAERKVTALKVVGIPASKMDESQNKRLVELVKTYVQRYRPELAEKDLAKIKKAGWQDVHFAWAGSAEPGQGHYYRVQGPTFLLEFDNTQNNANHIHAVWRDFQNDFGEDLLRQHYDQTPHQK